MFSETLQSWKQSRTRRRGSASKIPTERLLLRLIRTRRHGWFAFVILWATVFHLAWFVFSSSNGLDAFRSNRVARATATKECLDKREEVQAFCGSFQCRKQYIPRTREQPKRRLFRKPAPKCKTLWFSGFHEGKFSRCRNERGGGYRMDYAAALASARRNARDTLQPVLMLGRRSLKENEEISALREWAESQGAIVVIVDALSFEDDIDQWLSNGTETIDHPDLQQGPFLWFDIPTIIRDRKLFDLDGVCTQHVLFTDADVLFPNPITYQDVEDLKSVMWRRDPSQRPALMYGRERSVRGKKPKNTGVVVIDVPYFETLIPQMIQFRTDRGDLHFDGFDQRWMEHFFLGHDRHEFRHLVQLLPLYWNWKLYWRLRPIRFSDLKVIHFHGAKPERGAWMAARCQLDFGERIKDLRPYHDGISHSICCDDMASTSAVVMEFFIATQPNTTMVCGNVW